MIPKYIKTRDETARTFFGKVIDLSKRENWTVMTVLFASGSQLLLGWPGGSCCKCEFCKNMVPATEEEYDVAVVMNS